LESIVNIVAPETPIGELLQTLSVQAMSPVVTYAGDKPERPRHVYDITTRAWGTAFVYIFLRDGWPIYVGKSVNPGARFEKHGRRDWFAVANQYVLIQLVGADRYEADAMACVVESKAIRRLRPSHNVAGVSA
jgi:predicted GIY-YIG superfamily endonuclease